MKRLTKRLDSGKAVLDCDSCERAKTDKCRLYACRNGLIARLAAYEDIAELCGGAARLRELAEVDKAGRCVVLPCKVGDTVWRIKRTFEEYPDRSEPYIEPDAFLLQDVFNIGKTVFLTREEAEKALQEMESKKDGV